LKQPPLNYIVVSAAEYGKAFLDLVCLKQPPLDFVVVSAAEHGRAFLGFGLHGSTRPLMIIDSRIGSPGLRPASS
jgi:hypothetical protein